MEGNKFNNISYDIRGIKCVQQHNWTDRGISGTAEEMQVCGGVSLPGKSELEFWICATEKIMV